MNYIQPVRRIALAALAAFVFAPAAHAAGPCGVTATPVRGSAPLTVTFTAACTSTNYAWSFGDGEAGAGQTVQHVYRRRRLAYDAHHGSRHGRGTVGHRDLRLAGRALLTRAMRSG